LVPDLAESYSVDSTGAVYTVKLKKNIKWHDGQPFSANDVMFTYQTIKNPATKSYLEPSWRGVTLTKKDNFTVEFKLDNALSSFPNSLTNGIVPSHILKKVDSEQLRSIKFNNEQPIGTGPFKFETITFDKSSSENKTASIVLDPYVDYHFGMPKLEKYIIKSYLNPSSLEDAYKSESIDVASGLNDISKELAENNQVYNVPLSSEVMVFFKNTQEILKETPVRQALTLAINKQKILSIFNQPVVQINEPLLSRQIGYNKQYAQSSNNPDVANKILDTAGWKRDSPSDIRKKDGKDLKINLVGSDNSDFAKIMLNIQSQWRNIGVQADIQMMPEEDLQNNVSSHNYDALLYGISIGQDPDVYAYWHSSQSDIRSSSRLNLSEYKSTPADKALEAGRTRSEANLRAIKYKPFLEAWQKDYPAVALYQQQYLIVSKDSFNGFNNHYMHMPTDRYTNIQNWTIKKTSQTIKS
jgi:peptide/nickel transport system substrate-binding protein